MEQPRTSKRFFDGYVAKFLLAALALATLVGAFVYLGALLAIATFLFFGLAIPYYLGWKRLGQLALVGLVVLLIGAPIAALDDAASLRTPSPAASSAASLPYGNGGSVLQAGAVNPFTGDPGAAYNFTVTVHPEYLPANTSGLLWIELLVSTCPGANSSSSPLCGSGYPFYAQNESLNASVTTAYAVTFTQVLNGSNLWWFQFATAYTTNNGTVLTWIVLDPGNGYDAVQGPVTGDFVSTWILVVPLLYQWFFLYPGLVFFVALLVFYALKRREASRKAQMGPPAGGTAPAPTDGADGRGTPPSAAATTPAPSSELRCPSCKAVVYPNETSCWKCEAALGTPPASTAPLASGEKNP